MAMASADDRGISREDRKQARSWMQVARLAEEAINCLVAGKAKDAQSLLTAIRGVALKADSDERGATTNAPPNVRAATERVAVPK